MRFAIPHGVARCNYCLTLPSVEEPVYGILETECVVCGSPHTLLSALHIHARNPFIWLHGKDEFNQNQKDLGFALLESNGPPKYQFKIVSTRIQCLIGEVFPCEQSSTVLINDNLSPPQEIE